MRVLQAIIKRVLPYIEMEEFHPDNVAKVSKACKSICQWVRAMYVYHNVALQVEPKRAALAAAQAELDETNRQLATAQARLAEVQAKIAALEAAFAETMDKKATLVRQVADCEAKLQRADKLIGGLGGEKVCCAITMMLPRKSSRSGSGKAR
jgi:dynein heavy chain